MSTSRRPARRGSKLVGAISLALGLVALVALVWLWALSTTPLDPPQWVRILGIAFLPIGLLGALITGIAGLRGEGRRYAIGGLIAAAVTVIAFIVVLTVYG
ncbi:hypothetical protein [Agromyces bauzanensis]